MGEVIEENLNFHLDYGFYESKGVVDKYLFFYHQNKTVIQFYNAQNKRIDGSLGGSYEKYDKLIIYRSDNEDTIILSLIERKSFLEDSFDVPLNRQLAPDVVSQNIRYIYSNKKRIKKSYLNKNNQLVNGVSGYAEINYRFDELGREIEQFSTDNLGKLTNHGIDSYGYAKKLVEYNNDKIQCVKYLSESGDLMELKYQYLISDTIVTKTWSDKNGVRIAMLNSASGIGEVKSVFKKGEVLTSYYDLNGNLKNYMNVEVFTTCECASEVERKLNDGSTEVIYFDTIGKQIKRLIVPLPSEEIVSENKIFYKYDKLGNVIEEKSLDSLGKPSPYYDSSYKTIYKRNEAGLLLQVIKHGINEEVIGNSELIDYDSDGRVISHSYLDNLGNLISDRKQGFAKYTYKYDSKGNVLEYKTYGIDGTLMANNKGVAAWIFKYDSLNNLIESITFNNLEDNLIYGYPIEIIKIHQNYIDSSYSIKKYNGDSILVEIANYSKNNELLQLYSLVCGKLLEMSKAEVGPDGKIIETCYFIYNYNRKCKLMYYLVYRESTNDEIILSLKKKPINADGWHRRLYEHELSSLKYFNVKGKEVFYNEKSRKWQ